MTGRFVNIRGLDSDLNGTTYGGVRMPPSNPSSPFDGGRAVAFDVFPTGLVGGVEVTKTNRPDLDAEALGGTDQYGPRAATQGGKPFVELTAGGGYENLRETPVYDFGITTGRSFSRDGDGLVLRAQRIQRPAHGHLSSGWTRHRRRRGGLQRQSEPGRSRQAAHQHRFQALPVPAETYGFASNFDAKADEQLILSAAAVVGLSGFKGLQDLKIGNMDGGCVPPPVGNRGDTPANCAASSVYPNGFTSPAATFDINNTDESERIDTQLAVVGGKSLVNVLLEYHASLAQGRDVVNYNYGPDFTILNGGDSVAIAYDNNSNANYPNYNTTDGTNPVNPANYALTDLSLSIYAAIAMGRRADGTLPVTAWNAPGEVKFGLAHACDTRPTTKSIPIISRRGIPISLGSYSSGPDILFLTTTSTTSDPRSTTAASAPCRTPRCSRT